MCWAPVEPLSRCLQLERLESSKQVLLFKFEEELAQARQQVNVVSADHAKQRVQLVADCEHFKYEVGLVTLCCRRSST
jgi:hypothetical protein